MFLSMFEESRYHRQLALYKEKHSPSSVTGETKCNQCGTCCWTRPPRLSQTELSNIARSLGKTDREFFLECCVIDNPGGSSLCPVLIRSHQQHHAGYYLPAQETYSFDSPCAFLDQENGNACKFHSTKPFECSSHDCWNDSSIELKYNWSNEELIALGWSGYVGNGGDE